MDAALGKPRTNDPDELIGEHRDEQMRALAITGTTRLPALPQVPAFVEAGLPRFAVKVWFGVLAPAGTPKTIIDRLSAEFGKFLLLPDCREKLAAQGVEPFLLSPE